MKNYAAQSDPTRIPNFSRTWGDDPLGLPGFRHFDREIDPQAVKDVGRRHRADFARQATIAEFGWRHARMLDQADFVDRPPNPFLAPVPEAGQP